MSLHQLSFANVVRCEFLGGPESGWMEDFRTVRHGRNAAMLEIGVRRSRAASQGCVFPQSYGESFLILDEFRLRSIVFLHAPYDFPGYPMPMCSR